MHTAVVAAPTVPVVVTTPVVSIVAPFITRVVAAS